MKDTNIHININQNSFTMNKIILMIAITFASLCHCTTKPKEHEHDHGSEPMAYTVYSDKLEVFVEFNPFVVGHTSKFNVHFTVLGENFKPLHEGSVTVSLIVNGKGIKQKSEEPSVPGIYRLSLKPTIAGTGRLIFDIASQTISDQITIENVMVYADEKKLQTNLQHSHESSDITFLKEQAWNVEFANAAATRQKFTPITKTSGQILPAPGDEMLVTASTSGIVLFSNNKVAIGSAVNAMTKLFSITSGSLAEGSIDVKYKEAKANFEKSKIDFERSSELVKDNLVSQKEYLQTKKDFENASSHYNSISRNYSSSGRAVLAASNGYIKNIFITEGQFVEIGTPLANISKNKRLLLQANVSQKYFERLKTITAANFKTSYGNKIYNTAQLNGKIISYGKSVSTQSPFIPLLIEIDNTENLIPGSVVEIFLKSWPTTDALVIPLSALMEEQGIFYVYVQTEGESFQKREVTLGYNDGISVQLLSGVEEGERVVTKGAYQIKLSQSSGTLPAHGHEH